MTTSASLISTLLTAAPATAAPKTKQATADSDDGTGTTDFSAFLSKLLGKTEGKGASRKDTADPNEATQAADPTPGLSTLTGADPNAVTFDPSAYLAQLLPSASGPASGASPPSASNGPRIDASKGLDADLAQAAASGTVTVLSSATHFAPAAAPVSNAASDDKPAAAALTTLPDATVMAAPATNQPKIATAATAPASGTAETSAPGTAAPVLAVAPVSSKSGQASDGAADWGTAAKASKTQVVKDDTAAVSLSAVGQIVSAIANAVPGAEAGAAASATPGADPVQTSTTAPLKTLDLQLEPGNLGTVTLSMRMAGGVLQLHVAVSQPETLNALTKDRDTLSKSLEDTGYVVSGLTIAAAGPSDSPNLAQQDQQGTGPSNGQGAQPGFAQSDGRSAGSDGGRSLPSSATGSSADAADAARTNGDVYL